MEKTYIFTVTLDEAIARRAADELQKAGLTPEGLIRLILERTAKEGEPPIRKGRPARKKTPAAAMDGHFTQGDLFDDALTPVAIPEVILTEAAETDTAPEGETLRPALIPTLPTMTALQDSQAKLRWRARERASGAPELQPEPGKPRQLLETRQFRLDKSAIVASPVRPAIIKSLEALFTQITTGGVPADAIDLGSGRCFYAPLSVEGLPAESLAIIWETGDAEICLVRYGSPAALLVNPSAAQL